MNRSNAPIFVVGANRSGTTLVRLMLNAHPRIAIPEELNYFKRVRTSTPWHRPGWTDDAYARFAEDTLNHLAPLLPNLPVDAARERLLGAASPTYRTPYATLLEMWAAQESKVRWGEKTPGNLFFVDQLIEMFPDAQFIYVARDPRAGVASMQRVSFFPDDVIFNALNRRKSWNVGYRLLERIVPEAQRITIRYEDLVRAPHDMAETLCTFLNESYASAMLRFHTDAEHYMKAEAANSFNEAATRPISTARIDTWKDKLTPTEIGWIESLCADEMQAFGYQPTHPQRSLRARITQQIKSAYWHYDVWRHRYYRPYTVRHVPGQSLRNRLRDWSRWLQSRCAPLRDIASGEGVR